jgi:hypothetical protein
VGVIDPAQIAGLLGSGTLDLMGFSPPGASMNRKRFLQTVIGVPALLALKLSAAATKIQVYKTPTCGCCGNWVKHLRGNGFDVSVQEVEDTGVYRRKFGVPEKLQSCHTGLVEGYALEGHVPAAEVTRLLKERPKAKGIAVPGMPVGSPGMEGGVSQAYSVILFDAEGRTSVYQNYPGK